MTERLLPAGRIRARVMGLGAFGCRATALLAGVISALAFAPTSFFPILFIVIPVLVFLIDRSPNVGAAFVTGWWFGFGQFAAGLYWVGNSFGARGDLPAWLGIFASLALAIALAFFFAFAAMAARSYWRPGWQRVVALAISFSAFEWLRGHILTGFPWNLMANSWAAVDSMIQPVAVFGSYGLGFLTVLAAASMALVVDDRLDIRERLALPVSAAAVLLLLGAWGAARLNGSETAYHDGVMLRIVQANIPQREKWAREKLGDNFVRHMQLSTSSNGGLDARGITHIIWPETAIPYFIDREPSRRYFIARELGNQRTLITGARRLDRSQDKLRIFNSIQAIDRRGAIVATYDKHHLVPFGEYLPMRELLGLLGLDNLVGETIDFSSGPGLQTLAIPNLPPVGPLVCYEVIFPGQVANSEDRPAWLLNLTNDGWYGSSSGPYQHLTLARFRAVEEGLPVVRVAGTGISAVIDPWGRITASLALNRSGVLDAKLPRPSEVKTIYVRVRDGLFLLMLALAAAGLVLAARFRGTVD